MSELSSQAQVIWNTYIEGYSEALCTPVEQFDTSMDCYSRKILASVLRATVEQLMYMDADGELRINPKYILDIANELEQV